MVVLTGKFDGKAFIADHVPENLAVDTPVRIIVEPLPDAAPKTPSAFDAITGIAGDANLPPDFAAQHEHYTKGTPKR